MKNSKKGNLPLHHDIKISKDVCRKTDEELDRMSQVPYASTVGSIMYAMTCTRPDVSFALSMVSRHQQNSGEGHWTVVKNILKGMFGRSEWNAKKENHEQCHRLISKDLCPKTNEKLDRMSRVPYASAIGSIMYAMTCTRPDVSFALSMVSRHQQNHGEGYWIAKTDKDDSHSQSDWVFLLNGGAVTWKSLKQDTVVDSTCESEYIAACEALKEAIWMKNFIGDLGVVQTVQDPIEIFCDNKSAVALTKEPKDHGKSKHIEIKYHFVQSKVEEGHVIVKHIRSEDNPADPFTKALAKS
ncbi:hypothetical protein Tco_0280965 [Tanacetum coccineum]